MIGSDPEKGHGIAGGPPPSLPPPLPLLPPLLYPRGIRQPLREETREICPGGDTKRYGKDGWERQGPLPAKEGNDQGSQAGERAVGADGKPGGADPPPPSPSPPANPPPTTPPTTPPTVPPTASAEIATTTINPADVTIAAVSAELFLLGERKCYGRGRAEALPEGAAAGVRGQRRTTTLGRAEALGKGAGDSVTGGGDGRRQGASAGLPLSGGGVTGGADRRHDDRCRGGRGKRKSHGRGRELASPEGRAPALPEGAITGMAGGGER